MIDANVRRLGIGGSEVGAIFGCDENRDAFSVWAEKKGGLERSSAPNIRMVVGKALEPGVLKLYTFQTGREVEYCDETSVHPARPWMVYTPDALCKSERRGVDAKVVFWDQRRKWGRSADEIPQRVQLQCWWYMAALDYDVWDVAALVGEGEPRVYTIERDREAERVMLARVEEWHRRYILGDEHPPIGGGDASARWLQQAFPSHRRPDLRFATAEEIQLLTEYAEIRIAQRGLAERRGELENLLKAAIADREGLVWTEGRFTWRRCKDSEITDWESLALALLTFHIKDEEARERLLEDYTRTKPGNRRIRFEHDDLRSEDAA